MSSLKKIDLLGTPPLSSNKRPQARIGVFDSGVGGLTVFKAISSLLPHESVLYFGDTANLPYGTRSQAEILAFVRQILTWMVSVPIKMAIMACNTSSALALDIVRAEFAIPILGLILPGACAAVQRGRRIGVIATPATVKSNSYPEAILEIQPTAQVWQVGCPEFVPLIEGDRIRDPYTAKVSREYLRPLIQQQIDTLIYGCTHYPYLAPVLQAILSESVQRIDPAIHVAAAARQELQLLGLNNTQPAQPTRFYVSGCPEQFAQLAKQPLGYIPVVEQISLPPVLIDSSSQLSY